MKTCSRCGESKPTEAFSPRKRGGPQLKAHCKACASADTRARYEANPKRWLQYASEYRKDPSVRRKINDRRNELRRQDPALELWRLARVRARQKALAFNIEVADVTVPATCPVLGIPLRWGCGKRQLDESPTIDRIVPANGYVKGNVCVISWRANRLKSDATPDELMAVAEYARRMG
jgi:hypothetical protein